MNCPGQSSSTVFIYAAQIDTSSVYCYASGSSECGGAYTGNAEPEVLHLPISSAPGWPNGKAKSNIVAREVVIQGEVNGNIEATGIIVEDDAYCKGSIDIVRNHAEAAARG